jgi:hypothetical protein
MPTELGDIFIRQGPISLSRMDLFFLQDMREEPEMFMREILVIPTEEDLMLIWHRLSGLQKVNL